MARQKGLIRLLGRIGNVTFYEKNGETYARLSEGIDGDLIKTDRRFRRARENMAEFGGAAKAGKALRNAMPDAFQTFGNGRGAGRPWPARPGGHRALVRKEEAYLDIQSRLVRDMEDND